MAKQLKQNIFINVLCLISIFNAYAQYNFNPKASSANVAIKSKANNRIAQKLIFNENYIVALPYLEKAIAQKKTKGKKTELMEFQLGICHTMSKSPQKALAIFDSLEQLGQKPKADFDFWKATAYQNCYKFDQAIIYYNKSLNRIGLLRDERQMIKKRIQECEFAKKAHYDTLNFEIINAGADLNTMFSEHSPIFESDSKTMYFTSRKNITGQKASFTGEYFEDIYITKIDSNTWQKPQSHPDFNSKEHDACSQITNNNQTMVMYRSTKNGDIYISQKKNGKWDKPKPVNGLNSMSYESSAFITKDGNRIYFSSNKFSDVADLDIYYMDKTADGKWGRPQSIGNNINSDFDEDGIFITDDGNTLYFSSKGHNSTGGYDIFRSYWNGNQWEKPANLGFPINSPSDDIYYTITPNKKFAVFSSFREGGLGMRDIYLAIPTDKVTARFQISDSLTQKIVDSNLTIRIHNVKDQKIYTLNTNNGIFQTEIDNHQKYQVDILKNSTILRTDSIAVFKKVAEGLRIDIANTITYHKSEPIAKPITKADTVIVTKENVYGNIYFEENESKIAKIYWPILTSLINILKENGDLRIQIQGFADETGDEAYRKSLSELRAHNLYDFITSRGVSKKRVDFKGYGQTIKNIEFHNNKRAQFVKVK